MSAGSVDYRENDLEVGLKPFRRRYLGLSAGQFGLLALAAVVTAIFAAMWLDLIVALPVSVRLWLPRVAIGLAMLIPGVLLLLRSSRSTDDSIASTIDRGESTGGQILAGLQLATRPVNPATDLSQAFATTASNRAADRLQAIPPSNVFGTEQAKRALGILLLALVGVIVVALLVPSIAAHQVNRFLFPSADIPPYTGIEITLTPEHGSILYAEDLRATALAVGGDVDQMTLVATTADGNESTLPMLADGDGNFSAILIRVTEPLVIFARYDASRSAKHDIEVRLTPQILPPEVTVTPPKYTGGAVYQGKLPTGGLSGLAGTHVAWRVGSNRPLAEGHLNLTFDDNTAEEIIFTPASGPDGALTSVAGVMQLHKPGKFELSLVDVAGIRSHETIEGRIRILQDGRPVVRIASPKPMSLATPDVSLPVVAIADDDYGISSLTLYRSLNGSPARSIAANVNGSARVQNQWNLHLPLYDVVPGDEIQLFARAEDNDPSGAKGAESPVTTVRIISVEDFQRMMVQRKGAEAMAAKYQAARRHLESLAEAIREVEEAAAELESNPDSKEAQQKLQEKIAAAEQAAKRAAEAIAKSAKQPLPVDVDQELAKRLSEMAKLAAEMQKAMAGMKSQDSPQQELSDEEKEQLKQMQEQLGQKQKELTEQAIDPMRKMQQMMPLIAAQQRFVQLAARQRDLAERLNSLQQDEPTPESERRIAELENEQEQIRQDLDSLLTDIQRSAEQLPATDEDMENLKNTALDFVDAVRQSDAMQEMSSVQQELLTKEFPTAQQHAATAADILESFISKCDGMGSKACKNCKAGFKPSAGGPKLGNSIEQMLAMMGMKPGSSMKPGGNPGMGMGWGAGGGYAQRFPGPQNVGMYGSMPMPQASSRRGQGDSSNGTRATAPTTQSLGATNAPGTSRSAGQAGGQSLDRMPAQYRSQIAEYYRSLAEELGELDSKPGEGP